MKNRSRQREAILKVLRATDTHPTANWIYDEVRREIPNISLGTVYRNLDALAKAGMILSIDVGDGFTHYDGDTSAHLHLQCKCCEKIDDLRFDDSLITSLADMQGFAHEKAVYVLSGLCKNCKVIN